VTATIPYPQGCPQGVPWCVGDPDWHDDDRACHDSATVIVETGCAPCTRHDEHPGRGDVWVSLERTDEDGVEGPTQVSLLAGDGIDTGTHLSLDRAEELAYGLLRLVALARGAGVTR
jgi:hypothetical protein